MVIATMAPNFCHVWDGREKLPIQSDDVYHHIYLIRHGKYLENPKGQDVLSPIGIRQATVTGRRLHTLSRMSTTVKLVHSTLRRAVETTSLIADSLESIPTTPSDLLCEGTFGNEEVCVLDRTQNVHFDSNSQYK